MYRCRTKKVLSILFSVIMSLGVISPVLGIVAFGADYTIKDHWYDDSTANIESLFTGTVDQNGKIAADKTVTYGADAYNAFNSYSADEFSVTLSALAQAYTSKRYSTAEQEGILHPDVVFVVDVSLSMANTNSIVATVDGHKVTRAEATIEAMNNAITDLYAADPETRIGIVSFGSKLSGRDSVTETGADAFYLPLDKYTLPYGATDYVFYDKEAATKNINVPNAEEVMAVRVESGSITWLYPSVGTRALEEFTNRDRISVKADGTYEYYIANSTTKVKSGTVASESYVTLDDHYALLRVNDCYYVYDLTKKLVSTSVNNIPDERKSFSVPGNLTLYASCLDGDTINIYTSATSTTPIATVDSDNDSVQYESGDFDYTFTKLSATSFSVESEGTASGSQQFDISTTDRSTHTINGFTFYALSTDGTIRIYNAQTGGTAIATITQANPDASYTVNTLRYDFHWTGNTSVTVSSPKMSTQEVTGLTQTRSSYTAGGKTYYISRNASSTQVRVYTSNANNAQPVANLSNSDSYTDSSNGVTITRTGGSSCTISQKETITENITRNSNTKTAYTTQNGVTFYAARNGTNGNRTFSIYTSNSNNAQAVATCSNGTTGTGTISGTTFTLTYVDNTHFTVSYLTGATSSTNINNIANQAKITCNITDTGDTVYALPDNGALKIYTDANGNVQKTINNNANTTLTVNGTAYTLANSNNGARLTASYTVDLDRTDNVTGLPTKKQVTINGESFYIMASGSAGSRAFSIYDSANSDTPLATVTTNNIEQSFEFEETEYIVRRTNDTAVSFSYVSSEGALTTVTKIIPSTADKTLPNAQGSATHDGKKHYLSTNGTLIGSDGHTETEHAYGLNYDGTYTQAGIVAAREMLLAQTDTENRVPVIVLLTDGSPTFYHCGDESCASATCNVTSTNSGSPNTVTCDGKTYSVYKSDNTENATITVKSGNTTVCTLTPDSPVSPIHTGSSNGGNDAHTESGGNATTPAEDGNMNQTTMFRRKDANTLEIDIRVGDGTATTNYGGYITVRTAMEAKQAVDAHYKEGDDDSSDALFYSIGPGLTDLYGKIVIDPSSENRAAGMSSTGTGTPSAKGLATLLQSPYFTEEELGYVNYADWSISGNLTAEQISDAFSTIVQAIADIPRPITSVEIYDEDTNVEVFDGKNMVFVDTIGDGMRLSFVNNGSLDTTKLPKIRYADENISPNTTYDTTSLDDGTMYTISYSKTVTEASTGFDKDLDDVVLNIYVYDSGKQKLEWKIPADLVPAIYPDISGETVSFKSASPIRLIYKVRLNTTESGTYFTNSTTEPATCSFVPSEGNPYYYDTELDGNGQVVSTFTYDETIDLLDKGTGNKTSSLPYVRDFNTREYGATGVIIESLGNNGKIQIVQNELAPDSVVIDYGLPVKANVTGNDGLTGTVTGIATEIVSGTTLNTQSYSATRLTGSKITSTDDTLKLSYGTAKFTDDTVIYTPSSMQMPGAETIYYEFTQTGGARFYSTLTVIPATSIYYEDSFVTFNGTWSTAGTLVSDAFQAEDRPGKTNNHDADNVYGYDGEYTTMDTYSLGASKVSTVSATAPNKDGAISAEFTFTGTAFDVISVTSGDTGTVSVTVTGENGEIAKDVDDHSADWVVDTYYGYEFNEDQVYKNTWKFENGVWHRIKQEEVDEVGSDGVKHLPENPKEKDEVVMYTNSWAASSRGTLYQIPVIKSTKFDYGTYTVKITPVYSRYFDNAGDGSYDFYLDAVRIYDPVDPDDLPEVVSDAYSADNEMYPQYLEIKNVITSSDYSADDVDGDDGVLFLDGFTECDLTDSGASSTYVNYGPNNEIYLAKDQSIAFVIEDKNNANIASVQLAARIYEDEEESGASTTSQFTIKAVGGMSVTLPSSGKEFNTATDLYYDITSVVRSRTFKNNKSAVILVTNTGEGTISITNLKITYKELLVESSEAPARLTLSAEEAELARVTANEDYIARNTASDETENNSGIFAKIRNFFMWIVEMLKKLFAYFKFSSSVIY